MQDDRRIDVRTLVIASAASAAAAIVTSRFWIRGTPIAAALTPVIVALVSELLHRPTEKIAQRLTAETDALPEAAGAEPPPPIEETTPSPARDPEIRVYRRGRRRQIAWAVVLATGLLAFAIAAVALTVPELIAGGSLGKGDRRTTILGGGKESGTGEKTVTEEETVTAPAPAEPEPPPRTAPTVPSEPPTRTTPDEPTPTTPTTTAPAPSQTPPPSSPD